MDENDSGDDDGTVGGGRRRLGEPDDRGQTAGFSLNDDPWRTDEVEPVDPEEAEFSQMFNEFHDRADRLTLSAGVETGYEPGGFEPPEMADGQLRNRNLSPAVQAIRDDGPVGAANRSLPQGARGSEAHPEPAAPNAPPARDTGIPAADEVGNRHGAMAVLAGMANALAPGQAGYLRLLVISSVIVVLIGFTIWGKDNFSLDREARSVTPAPEIRINDEPLATPPARAELEQLRERQGEIIARQERLLRDIAELKLALKAGQEAAAAALATELEQQRQQLGALGETLSGLQARVSGLELPVSSLPAPAAGPASADTAGGWVVNLAAFADAKAGSALLASLQKAGVPAEQHQVTINGATRYRVRVGGFATRAEALQYKNTLASDHGIKDAWVAAD